MSNNKKHFLHSRYQVFEESGKPFQFVEKDVLLDVKPGEVVVKILQATICGSDLHTIEGKRIENVPCILGHEAVGEIVEISGRKGFAVGDRITWTIADSCGHCPACIEYGLPEKCSELFKYGHASLASGTGLNGCYASHLFIRKGTHIVKIPNAVTNGIAAPANCALATMVNGIAQLKSKPRRVLIQGGGLLGIYGCGMLKEMGVPQIFCSEVNEGRFDLIRSFGAIPVDTRNSENAANLILEQTSDGVDAIFEVAGVKELIPQGLKLLRPGGEYILAGLVHPDSQLNITAEQIIRKCISIKGVHNYAPWHLDKAVAFLERNISVFPFEDLVSPPYKLDNLQEAVSEARKHNWMRVSIKP